MYNALNLEQFLFEHQNKVKGFAFTMLIKSTDIQGF